MSRAYYSATIAAPIDTVWSVVADFDGVQKWVNRIRDSVTEGDGAPNAVGSVRRVTMKLDGQTLRERLVSYDAQAKTYSYEFVEAIPFPVRSYLGTIQLLPVTETDTTFIQWYGDFDADAAAVAELEGAIIGVYREFVADLAQHVAQAAGA